MLSLITEEKEIQAAHELFMNALKTAKTSSVEAYLGFPGGGGMNTVDYSAKLGIFWFCRTDFTEAKGKHYCYFNAIGLGHINNGDRVSTKVHLNYAAASEKGEQRSAVFAKDSERKVYLLHSGNIRFPSKSFWHHYKGKQDRIGNKQYAFIGELSSEEFYTDLVNYVQEIYSMKVKG